MLWEGVVWIVWANGTSSNRPLTATVAANASVIRADWDFTWEIVPAEIINNADRPDLTGPNAAPPPNGAKRHVVSNNPLSDGADKKWDESRQGNFKVINPHLYAKSQFPLVAGTFFDNQPVAEDLPDIYPTDPVEGNDDSSTNDPEDNDPYNSPNQGKLTGVDNPQVPMITTTGVLDETVELRFHFREFARIELGGVWYRISDSLLWPVHYKYRKANTEITTGNDGICNTVANGDDTQLIAIYNGRPEATAITAGTDLVVNTTPGGDDQLVGNVITAGANGISETMASGDDVQVIPLGNGEPNASCIASGVNAKLDTVPGGDDAGAKERWVDNGSDQAANNDGF